MTMQFKKATRHQAKARIALVGQSNGGKTYTALKLATYLGGRIAVIDSERGSSDKYASTPKRPADPEKGVFDFDQLNLESFNPKTYIDAIRLAEQEGFDVLIIDSLSHAWSGKGGALEMVDNAAKKGGNSYTAWRDVTPLHNQLIDAIVGAKMHVIATMRAKTEYVIEKNEKGKSVPRKVGMQAIQREGMEYEFDIVADMTDTNDMIISKTRCSELAGNVYPKPGKEVAAIIKSWLSDGEPTPVAPPPVTVANPTPTPPPPSAPESGPQVATPPTAEVPAMATRAQEIQTAMLAAKDEADLGGWRDIAKKEMKGQYFDACKKAYSRRFRELNPKKAAS